MKAKYTLVALALGMSVASMAQESDDLYFNSRDRLSQNEVNQLAMAKVYHQQDQEVVKTYPVNPSDTYSGRGVNPEYNAQPKNGATLVQNNPDYFLAGYAPKDINSSLYSGTSPSNYSTCNCAYNNASAYSGFGSPYNSFYSPYSMYSPYGMYGGYPGMTTSMGYGFGSYGSMMSMGMSYGMGMYGYGYPSYGYNPYGYNPYGSVYYAPYSTADSGPTYGRHPSRSSSLNNGYDYVGSGQAMVGTNGRVRDTSGARTSQSNYYDPSWRSNMDNYPSRTTSNYPGMRSSGSSWDSSPGMGRSTMDMGRTRSTMDSFGSPSHSSFGGASGGASSGGHSRGRN